jgi:transposase
MSKLHVGLDVSDLTTALCVVNDNGEILFETSVRTTPTAILAAIKPYRSMLHSVGLETGTKSAWLYDSLAKRRVPVVCMDSRYAHAALAARPNKSDKNDARGLAILLCRGLFTSAHVRSIEARKIRLLLSVRKALQRKAIDLQMCAHMSEKTLCGTIGSNFRRVAQRDRFEQRRLIQILSRCSNTLFAEVKALDKLVIRASRGDPVCRRLMTIPGVGPIAALSFRAGVDDPTRFKNSRSVGAYFGLAPRLYQSGQSLVRGHISRMGDRSVRTALFSASLAMFRATRSNSALRHWALALAERKGKKLAVVAGARKLAIVMHRVWITGRDFSAFAVPT